MDIEKIRRSAGIIGESEDIQEVLALIGQVANTDISILITGESGSGKEVVAKAIHKNSRRKFEKMITVNCAAIPSGIIESELFGHKKGSFTGATENKKGYFKNEISEIHIKNKEGTQIIDTDEEPFKFVVVEGFAPVDNSNKIKYPFFMDKCPVDISITIIIIHSIGQNPTIFSGVINDKKSILLT